MKVYNCLIGQVLKAFENSNMGTMTFVFESYILAVYNKCYAKNLNSIDDLIGEKVDKIVINPDVDFALIFSSNKSVIVLLDDNSYAGPEAMSLQGPDGLNIVW